MSAPASAALTISWPTSSIWALATPAPGFGRNSTNWSLAWALYAGLSYDLSKSLKVDLAYRYLNYGSVTDTIDCIGGCIPELL